MYVATLRTGATQDSGVGATLITTQILSNVLEVCFRPTKSLGHAQAVTAARHIWRGGRLAFIMHDAVATLALGSGSVRHQVRGTSTAPING